jgi:hypothetical protein
VAAYRVDPDRSSVTAVLRPTADRPLAATIRGTVEVDDRAPSTLDGTVHLALTDPPGEVALDVSSTRPELDRGPDGELLLRGSATRPAGAFGLTGPPLLNPTVVLRWRAVLVLDG